MTEYSLSGDGKKIIYVHTDTVHLPDVFLFDLDNKTNERLTNLSEALLDTFDLQPAETYWYKSYDGLKVQGWIIGPAHFDNNKKYPLILVIHGGPHNMFGYEFEPRMQLLSANG